MFINCIVEFFLYTCWMYSNCFINCWDRGIDVSKLIVYLFNSFSDLSVSNSHSLQFCCFLLCLLGVLIHYYVVYPFLIIFLLWRLLSLTLICHTCFLCLHGITFSSFFIFICIVILGSEFLIDNVELGCIFNPLCPSIFKLLHSDDLHLT